MTASTGEVAEPASAVEESEFDQKAGDATIQPEALQQSDCGGGCAPVARRSSTRSTCSPGFMASTWIATVADPYPDRNSPRVAQGSLSLSFETGTNPAPSFNGRGAKNKTPASIPTTLSTRRPRAARDQMPNGEAEQAAVQKDRGDVLELDAWFRKIRNVVDGVGDSPGGLAYEIVTCGCPPTYRRVSPAPPDDEQTCKLAVWRTVDSLRTSSFPIDYENYLLHGWCRRHRYVQLQNNPSSQTALQKKALILGPDGGSAQPSDWQG